MPPSLELVFIALVFVFAGFVKGVIGLGLPTIAVGLLGLIMSPIAAASLLVVPNFVTNAWQLATGPRFTALLRRLSPLLIGIVAGTVAGAPLITEHPSRWSTFGLGAALAFYAVSGLMGLTLKPPTSRERPLSLLVGAITGVIASVTGVFVVPAVPYLQALELDRDELVQALGLSFMVSTIALAIVLARAGLLQPTVAGGSLLAVLPALLGMAIGAKVRAVIRPEPFRRCFFAGLLMLGGYLVLRAVLAGQA
jgi:uncharacterized membrane protein YfcA